MRGSLFVLVISAVLGSSSVAAAQTLDPKSVSERQNIQTMPLRVDWPEATRSVPALRGHGDSVAEGLLIGAAVGAVAGFWIIPQVMCGSTDTECATIVKVVVGLPVFAGSIVAGGLIDKYAVRGPVVWRDGRGRTEARAGIYPNGGVGAQVRVTLGRSR